MHFVKEILVAYDFENVWMDQYVHDEASFLIELRKRLNDRFICNWKREVENTSDNRIYKLLKEDFQFENYLCFIKCRNIRIAVTRMRLSSHNFLVERGRWIRPKMDIQDRICDHCKHLNALEDEYHCLVECPAFQEIRTSYLPKSLRFKPNMQKFIVELKMDTLQNLFRMGRLCFHILNKYALLYK